MASGQAAAATLRAYKNVVLTGGAATLMAGVVDAENGTLSASLTRPTSTGGVTVVSPNGAFISFTPNAGNKQVDASAEFAVAISDGTAELTRTFRVDIGAWVAGCAARCAFRLRQPMRAWTVRIGL